MPAQLTRLLLVILLFVFAPFPAVSQLNLPKIFSDHMILQRGKPIPIWGKAKARDRVRIAFNGNSYDTRADQDGKWRLDLPSMRVGGPYKLSVSTRKEEIVFQNVMLGDVWLCSGQSNMEWPLWNTNGGEEAVNGARYKNIRLFNVSHNIQYLPTDDFAKDEKWMVCSPENVRDFSAVGYLFGKQLHIDENVPIGLISSNWGGTRSEPWTSREGISVVDGFENSASDLTEDARQRMEATYKAKLTALQKEVGNEPGLVNGKAVWAAREVEVSQWKNMKLPNLWESQGLTGLDGVVWFRKEINLSEELASQPGQLFLGPIDDSDMTWVNGQLVGQTEQQYNKAREYDVPAGVLMSGRNVITIRVEDTGGGGGLWGNDMLNHLDVGRESLPLSGTWQYRISPVGLSMGDASIGPNSKPTVLYNGMIAPMIPFAIKGAIWYQGESNVNEAYEYRKVFPAMIRDWRKQWNDEFPFFFVQLANFHQPVDQPGESDWAELREAQDFALRLPQTGKAVIIDIGEADDIHPRNKVDVAKRLALAARKVAYNRELIFSGPTYSSMMKLPDHKMSLTFRNIGSGLMAKDPYGYVKGFAIAGKDQKFHWAQAWIEGDQVIVYSPHVQNPVAVRYAWADNPHDANLYNKEGLPASPFRTDNWKGITAGNHKVFVRIE
ncbi:MAG: sialate O-acetylesterase [Bacteroidota bacterium]